MAEDNDNSGSNFDDIDLDGLKATLSEEYSPFNPELDEKYPVKDLLTPENVEVVSAPDFTGMGWVSLFCNSPTKNGEAEMMMGTVVKRALAAQQWVDIPVRKDEPMAGELAMGEGVIVDFSKVMLEFERGGKILQDKGLMQLVIDDDGGQRLKPLEPLIQFIWERTKQFSPRRAVNRT